MFLSDLPVILDVVRVTHRSVLVHHPLSRFRLSQSNLIEVLHSV